jgi:transposase
MRSTNVSSEDKEKILALANAKTCYKVIANSFNVSRSCIKSIVARNRLNGDLPPKVKVMKRLTDGRVGTRLKEIIKDNNKIPYRDLPGQLAKSITPGIPIPSATTCQRFLKQNGYKIVKMIKKPLISDINKIKRMEFAKKHVQKEDEWFDRIVWSDETTVRQAPKGQQQLIWTHTSVNKDNLQTNLQIHSGGFSVMFFGCFSNFGIGPLVALEQSMNAAVYMEVIEQHVIPEIQAAKEDFGVNLIFMQDNAPCHKAKVVMDFFRDNGIEPLPWPAQSPDLNPIENLWAILKQRRQKKFGMPSSRDELVEQVFDIWNSLEPELCLSLSKSARKRLIQCIDRNGRATKY